MKLRKLALPTWMIAFALTMFGIYMAFVYTPAHSTMGDVQRIFYFHVASAWVAYMAFGVTFLLSLVYLKTHDMKWDKIASASAELGVVFCTMAITTGPLWGKAVWGVYWRWEDMKLFMTLVLWLVFIAYVALRANTHNKAKRANLSAVFSIIGFIAIPFSFAANRIWQQYHPTVVMTESGSLQTSMTQALMVAVFAFTFLYVHLLVTKVRLEGMKERIESIKHKIEEKR